MLYFLGIFEEEEAIASKGLLKYIKQNGFSSKFNSQSNQTDQQPEWVMRWGRTNFYFSTRNPLTVLL